MKQKKLVMYFLMITISLTSLLPLVNVSFAYINHKINLQDFSKKKLFSTDNFEAMGNYFVYKTFNISLNKPQVIAGKDTFLFLGNNYAKVLDKTKGTFAYSIQEIDTWTDKLKDLQKWYERRSIKFIIAIAPNKHTIYSDKLPNSIPYTEGKTITDDIVNYAKKKGIHILNLKPFLVKEKKDKQLYFYTDTYWNNYSASLGFKNTIQHLNIIYNTTYKMPSYDFATTKRISGDLANFLKISTLLPKDYESDYTFLFNKEYQVCHGEITKDHHLKKCNITPNPIMGINNIDQYMINDNSVNKEKLLLLCDSFGTANSKPYNATFNTIWKFHYGHIHGEALSKFIKKHKPDIVVYQVAKRGLYDNIIVQNLNSSDTK